MPIHRAQRPKPPGWRCWALARHPVRAGLAGPFGPASAAGAGSVSEPRDASMRPPAASSQPVISVIIPTLNEADRLPNLLSRLRDEAVRCEILVSDGGSTDGTPAVAAAAGVSVLTGPPGRGQQLARGAAAARGELLLFLHADSLLPAGGLAAIEAALAAWPEAPGGNFRLLFDGEDPFSRWLEGFYAFIRRHGLYYGDSAIFVRRPVLQAIGGIRPIALMEDFDLVRRLERAGPTLCIETPPLVTSSRRFAGRRPAAIVAGWLWLHLLYLLGAAPERLARLYDSARRRVS
jgi:rSAM/selenodomain-associated transferase 2